MTTAAGTSGTHDWLSVTTGTIVFGTLTLVTFQVVELEPRLWQPVDRACGERLSAALKLATHADRDVSISYEAFDLCLNRAASTQPDASEAEESGRPWLGDDAAHSDGIMCRRGFGSAPCGVRVPGALQSWDTHSAST